MIRRSLLREFFHSEFPARVMQQCLHITQLELLTVLVAVKMWHSKLQGLAIEIMVDNKATVHAINNQRSKDPLCRTASESSGYI